MRAPVGKTTCSCSIMREGQTGISDFAQTAAMTVMTLKRCQAERLRGTYSIRSPSGLPRWPFGRSRIAG